jgi:hypothetical protein
MEHAEFKAVNQCLQEAAQRTAAASDLLAPVIERFLRTGEKSCPIYAGRSLHRGGEDGAVNLVPSTCRPEAAISKLGSKTCRFGTVFSLDVVHNGGFFPCEKRGNHQPDALAGTSRCERQDVLGPVVSQVMEPARTFLAPPAHVNSAPSINEAGLLHIVRICPTG